MIIDFFVQQKNPTEDGSKIFFQNELEQLALTPGEEPYKSIELSTTVLFHGEWKQGKKRQYFNVVGIGEGEEQKPKPATKDAPKYKADPDKIDSIESQVAFKGIIELRCAGKIEPEHFAYRWAMSWALEKLGAEDETIQAAKAKLIKETVE